VRHAFIAARIRPTGWAPDRLADRDHPASEADAPPGQVDRVGRRLVGSGRVLSNVVAESLGAESGALALEAGDVVGHEGLLEVDHLAHPIIPSVCVRSFMCSMVV
jgi:hypothetical protein